MTFRILERQMKHLGAQTRQRFSARMAGYLRSHFPAWVESMSETELGEWCQQALDKAAVYGVTNEPEAAQLILLFAAMGLDADERYEWVASTLKDRQLAAIGKVRRLVALGKAEVPAVKHVAVFPEMES